MRIRIFGCTMAMSSRFPRNRPAKPEIRNPKFEIRSKSEDTNVPPLDGSLIAAAKTIEPQRHRGTEKLNRKERKGERESDILPQLPGLAAQKLARLAQTFQDRSSR